MSANYSYAASENIDTSAKSAGKVEKGIKRLVVIAAVIFTAELVWLFGISPFIPFSTIDVQGFAELGRQEILTIAGIDDTSSYMSTNIIEIQEKLSKNILVESAKVIKRFPDKLSIFLTPRVAVMTALTGEDLQHIPLYVDRQGVFFKFADNAAQTAELPILSGIENPKLNSRLTPALVPLVERISVIADGSPELLSSVSEIRVEPKAWDGYELVVFPVHSSIKVRVENKLNEDVLRYMLLMLNIFENDSNKPEEIDFRSGMGSYKLKEKSLW